MGTVSDLSLKSQDLQGPGGIMCDHLFDKNIPMIGRSSIPLKYTREPYVQSFQYHIILRIRNTNERLGKRYI